jgi:hypothetical protein
MEGHLCGGIEQRVQRGRGVRRRRTERSRAAQGGRQAASHQATGEGTRTHASTHARAHEYTHACKRARTFALALGGSTPQVGAHTPMAPGLFRVARFHAPHGRVQGCKGRAQGRAKTRAGPRQLDARGTRRRASRRLATPTRRRASPVGAAESPGSRRRRVCAIRVHARACVRAAHPHASRAGRIARRAQSSTWSGRRGPLTRISSLVTAAGESHPCRTVDTPRSGTPDG